MRMQRTTVVLIGIACICLCVGVLGFLFRPLAPFISEQNAESAIVTFPDKSDGVVEMEVNAVDGQGISVIPELWEGSVHMTIEGESDDGDSPDVYWNGYITSGNTLNFPTATGCCAVTFSVNKASGKVTVTTLSEESWREVSEAEEERYRKLAQEELAYGQ